MFPKVRRKISKEEESVKIQFLKEDFELILDKDKCVGCGTCARVCPKEAISRGPVGAAERFPKTEDIIPEVYDPSACVFCGTCVYMCPFSSLKLKKNGEVLELEEIPIVEQHAVPKLEFEAKKLDDGRVVKQYVEAEVSIEHEECAQGCSTCAEVCPSGAIEIAERPEHGWEQSKAVDIADEDACVGCGACTNACPTGAVHLKITDIKSSGEYNEIFWDEITKKLKSFKGSEKEE
ncbi:MAG: 4Fe-4S binding protein [Promethearchaeia archaeon]